MDAVVPWILAGGFAAAGVGVGFLLLKGRAEKAALEEDLVRFSAISDVEAECERVRAEAQKERIAVAGLKGEKVQLSLRLAAVRSELDSVEESLELQSFGVYTPRYGFEHVDEYVETLKGVRSSQKAMIKGEQAAKCSTEWKVEGSAAKGRKMVKEHIKLMLRAFNGEADAAISKVRYSNVAAMETRLKKTFEAINKLGRSKNIAISPRYLAEKLNELYLVHEHREAVQAEKEEQKRIRDQMREEQKAQRELEQAQKQAEKEEDKARKELEKAKAKLQSAPNQEWTRLQELVDSLEGRLSEALDRKSKAIARAQLTRSGHVYVLSNIGSFGEGVYKVGLTRRLDPQERVKELGSASVPFQFDVHAMIWSEDAPALERALHKKFEGCRVNRVNARKEYFRVSLDEIRKGVADLHGIVTFMTTPEAEEYRKTVALLEGQESQTA